MISITLLPNDVSASLNPLDSESVVRAAEEHRDTLYPTASVATDDLSLAYLYASDPHSLCEPNIVQGLTRPMRPGDILTLRNIDYVVLAYGFHKLFPQKWTI